MSISEEKIELRSEKVRNLIGKVPPLILRIGSASTFIIVLGLLSIAYFFKYDNVIRTTAFIETVDSNVIVSINIPVNQFSNIHIGSKVVLDFSNIPHLYEEICISQITSTHNLINVTDEGGFYKAKIEMQRKVLTESNLKLVIEEPILINAQVITDKISLVDRFLIK